MLLMGCGTRFGAPHRYISPPFQLLPPGTFKQPITVFQKISIRQGGNSQNLEAVLNIDAGRIYLIILSPLGQRLATLTSNDGQIVIEHSAPFLATIPLENILGELQMIFWPTVALNASKRNKGWHFEEQKHTRYVYYRQRLIAEIHRHSTSPWDGYFDYISKVSDYRLIIRSKQLNQ